MGKITTKVIRVKIDDLKPTSNNPRQISKKEFEILKTSLKEFPEMLNIREVVVDEDMTVLGGHQRLNALLDNGETEVTVKQVFGLTKGQKKEFIIKDNIANGDWNYDILANEWDDLPLNDWGLLSSPKIDWADVEELSDETYEKPEHEMLECPQCHHQDRKIHFKTVKE